MTNRLDNPKRPPKQWWKDCTLGVAVNSPNADPESVCGALWHQKMSAADKRRIVREAEGKRLDNPGGGVALLVGGVALALGAGWLLLRKKDATTSCAIDLVKLNNWAVKKQMLGGYFPTLTKAPTLTELKAMPMASGMNFDTGYPVVVVIGQGDFYKYDASGNPLPAPEWKADYCAS